MTEKSPIVIFGAGFLGNDAFRFVRRYGFSLYGFMDNNPKLWHTEHLRYTVYAPQDIADIPAEAAFLIAIERDADGVRRQLLRSGISEERIQIYSHRMEAQFYQKIHSGRPDVDNPPYPKGEQDDCMGCGACVAVCDAQAVTLQTDEWGYYRGTIDGRRCRHCGKCQAVCPAKHRCQSPNEDKPRLYAFYARDGAVLDRSSSGGMFPLLAEAVMETGGAVAGAAWRKDAEEDAHGRIWDNGFYAVHTVITEKEDIAKLKKSKYMQSYMGDTVARIGRMLGRGQKVLFSGCPCQVAGLKAAIGDEDNLFTVDLLCGNAPSAGFFQKYLEDSFCGGIDGYEFRYKETAWNGTTVRVKMPKNQPLVLHGGAEDDYQRVYHNHTMCPRHCEHCRYQTLPRWGDITAGDFWGLAKHDESLVNDRGTSAVLVNNEKGARLMDQIPDSQIGQKKAVPLSWLGGNGFALSGRHNFASPYRDRFYGAVRKMPFSEAVDEAFFGGFEYV